MGDRSHHAVRRSSRQLGIGVERDHEAELGKNREIPDLHGKTVVLVQQELIEIEQLSALALPSHPSSLARVVDPVAMEKEKRAHTLSGVSFIEFTDQSRAQCHQRTFFRRGLIGIRQIGYQRKMNITIVVAQETYFQIFHQGLHLSFAEQERRNRNQGRAVVGNALGEVKFGQSCHREQVGDDIVHQLNCRLGTWQ